MAVLPIGMSGEAGGYQIERSLRFNSADSAYLNRTPGSAGNRKTWTWSGWVKRSALGASTHFFGAYSGSGSDTTLFTVSFNASDQLDISAFTQNWRVTSQVFRDVGAWYHIVIAFDTTQATAGDRIKLYVNGTQVTAFGTSNNPTQNTDYVVNNTVAHYIGVNSFTGNTAYFNGYITDINFIDGQALTPSSFGYTNPTTGVWSPLIYRGSYGTNGFWLTFNDNSSTAALGTDYSGNGNTWTVNNFSVTAGAGNDSLVDTPTPYGTDTGAGGQVRGNYATLNPLNGLGTISNGNLTQTNSNADHRAAAGTFGMSSGKWYWEITLTTAGTNTAVGIAKTTVNFLSNQFVGQSADSWGYLASNGEKYNNNTNTTYGSSWNTSGTVIGVAFDADAGTLVFYRNNVSQGTAFSSLTSGPYVPAVSNYGSGLVDCNFGQRPFAYTAPSGFKALCTQNLPEPTVVQGDDYFNPVLYTGNGNTTAQAITGTGFQPDFVWIKARSNSYVNLLFDAVRGAGKQLISELTNAESTVSNFVSFDSDGFTVNATGGASSYNANGTTYVAWNWKANGSGVSNTAGSITSTVSANTTSGFSIVTYTGTGANATVGHGLGVAPSMIILKGRSTTYNWRVYHTSVGNTGALFLDLTDGFTTVAEYWNNTSPTSTVFSLGTNAGMNQSAGTYVAYCFAPVPGFSAFGSYTGNGSTDGPFIYTGFRPAFVMVKKTSASGEGWWIYDNKRDTFNITDNILEANSSNVELSGGTYPIDMASNGWKIRGINGLLNSSGANYIYAAFAENPFKYSLAR